VRCAARGDDATTTPRRDRQNAAFLLALARRRSLTSVRAKAGVKTEKPKQKSAIFGLLLTFLF